MVQRSASLVEATAVRHFGIFLSKEECARARTVLQVSSGDMQIVALSAPALFMQNQMHDPGILASWYQLRRP
jgi:hypothetical protein